MPPRLTTPTTEEVWPQQQKPTPVKARIQERNCPDCIQYSGEPKEKDRKRFHCWAAIGFDFKSDIYFYNVPGNSNGKMTQRVYIDSILDPIVKPWIQAGHDFALEEDGDSGHGPARNGNIVRQWKTQNGLESYFNCASSPDLAPIENCWLPPKQHLRKYPHWDDTTTIELINEGWALVSQDYINKRVLSMPERFKAVIEANRNMTGF
jgi:hypothetical protein